MTKISSNITFQIDICIMLNKWSGKQVQSEADVQRCYVKKVFLEISQNSQENTCAKVSFSIRLQAQACNFIKRETLAQVFSREFCEISKNTYTTEHLQTTASFVCRVKCILIKSLITLLIIPFVIKIFTDSGTDFFL